VQLLGANVRHHRKLKGLSQERLALDAGMERSYVNAAPETLMCEHWGDRRMLSRLNRSCCWNISNAVLHRIPLVVRP
jgi:hypothetical protein